MKLEYIAPFFQGDAFNCPSCHVYAQQKWFYMAGAAQSEGYGRQFNNQKFLISNCEKCNFPTIWLGNRIVFPLHTTAEPPNKDLPADIKADYEEAREIANLSPRGAAALLRLGIQKLCAHLGQPGKNINKDIKALVEDGLPHKVQQALDSVRVIYPTHFKMRVLVAGNYR